MQGETASCSSALLNHFVEENTSFGVVDTAATVGLDITVKKRSIGHRLHTGNCQYG